MISIKGLSNRQLRSAFILLTFAAFSMLPASTPAASTELRDARRLFEKGVNKITRDFNKEHQAPLDKYEADLNKVLNYMKKKQDDFGSRPTEKELERFKEERTVPLGIVEGLPKLIQKARDRYAANVKPVKMKRNGRMNSLLDNYFAKLSSLETSLGASGDTADLAAVQKEIARVKAKFGTGTPAEKADPNDFSVVKVSSTLSGNYLNGIGLMYVMKARAPMRLRDMSGRGRHGRLIGASVNDEDVDALSFLKFHEVIEVEKPLPVGSPGWTIITEVKFPLEGKGNQRVLVAGAFRKDHIVVDPIGMLGVGANTFKTCGFDTTKLKGWRRLAAVGNTEDKTTTFYIDGQIVGTSQAVCLEPVRAIGNCVAYGKPFHGELNSILVWNRRLAPVEIQKLPKTLLK